MSSPTHDHNHPLRVVAAKAAANLAVEFMERGERTREIREAALRLDSALKDWRNAVEEERDRLFNERSRIRDGFESDEVELHGSPETGRTALAGSPEADEILRRNP